MTPEGETAPNPQHIVVDTSFFTNPDARGPLGENPTEALRRFVDLARNRSAIEFYMPPSVYEELRHFVDVDQIPKDFEFVIRLRSPRRFQIMVPGFLLYELIDEVRERINRGLRVAEAAVRETREKDQENIIALLRERYRKALREGIIDSREDVDLILLAMELDAALLTADQGVIRWAERIGLRILHPTAMISFLLGSL